MDNNMKSESIKELCAALSKAQGELDHAKKDNNNAFFKSKYADLASCIDAAKTALFKNGLAVTQTTEILGTGLVLRTTLMHASGEWICGLYPIESDKKDPQRLGSALTYARRYAFCAITGVASDDDDGNRASNNGSKENLQQDYIKLIESSETIQELMDVWKSIPLDLKHKFEKIKNDKKYNLDPLMNIKEKMSDCTAIDDLNELMSTVSPIQQPKIKQHYLDCYAKLEGKYE